jgi:hypothetical protein
VPAALGAFLVIEFVGANITEWASVLASAIYLAAFAALAITVWTLADREWDAVALPDPRREPLPAGV